MVATPWPGWVPLWQLLVLGAALASLAGIWFLARPGGRWGARLRTRFVMGIPLGTLLAMAFVIAFYLFAQGGWSHWDDPVTLPFAAWSYFYPLGMASASFAHAGPAHLTGNMVGTLTFGILAEYAVGHFPNERGSETFGSLRTNPFARAVGFAGGVLAMGLFTSVFALGPVIGFSGVVFAFAGFALVRYPIGGVLALVLTDLVGLVESALRNPVTTAEAGRSFSRPWWANVAIQGHYLGFLAGIVLGVALVYRRNERPDPLRLWVAVLVFGTGQSLWILYAPQGSDRFVLFRALGVAVLFVLAAAVTAGARSSTRPLVASIDLSRREAATGFLIAVLLAVAAVSVPLNILAVGNGSTPAASVEVRDYTVFYDEDIPHQLVPAIDVPGADDTGINASGVIVVSEERSIWWVEVSRSRLASRGEATVVLGGPGWRQEVVANRTGWSAVGGDTVYRIALRSADGQRVRAFNASAVTAEPTVDGRNVTVRSRPGGFGVRVSRRNRTLGTAPMPARNRSVTVGGLRLERDEDDLVATRNGTRVRVAGKETY